MTRGVRSTPEQQALLKSHSTRSVALDAGLARDTVAHGRRGEPVTRANLRAMLEAAERLSARKASATTPSPAFAPPTATRAVASNNPNPIRAAL